MNKSVAIICVVVVALLIGIGIYGGGPSEEARAEYETFSQCLADNGATFYGAFWCPHCGDQKELLENAASIPYVECSTPDRRGQTQECVDAGIESYPTWEFADGERLTGTQSLETLAEQTGCALPNASDVSAE